MVKDQWSQPRAELSRDVKLLALETPRDAIM
jgi:hypothetical protein